MYSKTQVWDRTEVIYLGKNTASVGDTPAGNTYCTNNL